jgi:hypothetical protein
MADAAEPKGDAAAVAGVGTFNKSNTKLVLLIVLRPFDRFPGLGGLQEGGGRSVRLVSTMCYQIRLCGAESWPKDCNTR